MSLVVFASPDISCACFFFGKTLPLQLYEIISGQPFKVKVKTFTFRLGLCLLSLTKGTKLLKWAYIHTENKSTQWCGVPIRRGATSSCGAVEFLYERLYGVHYRTRSGLWYTLRFFWQPVWMSRSAMTQTRLNALCDFIAVGKKKVCTEWSCTESVTLNAVFTPLDSQSYTSPRQHFSAVADTLWSCILYLTSMQISMSRKLVLTKPSSKCI